MTTWGSRSLRAAPAVGFLALAAGCGRPPATLPEGKVVEMARDESDLRPGLARHAQLARDAGLRPYAQLYADWCQPCVALRNSMGDPQMAEAFRGTYVVRLAVDSWNDALSAEFADGMPAIPAFYAIDADGRLGRTINGGAWGDDVPSNMAPPLQAYFREAASATP